MPELHLAVALDGAGAHPAAWREPGARPDELFTARYWADVVAEAETGLLDFVTFDDGLALQSASAAEPDTRTDHVRGRLDAVLTAARIAPLTRHIGLVPGVTVTHTEPFHLSKALATLDHVSRGRAGVHIQTSGLPHEARHFGRREFPVPVGELAGEAADHIEVIRRLWDSWEDDAEIRDTATGRFIDRDKLHYVDFKGPYFSVRGPSITPRPPQGQPLVTARAGTAAPRHALVDLVYITPRDADEVRAVTTLLTPPPGTRHVFADLTVFLDEDQRAADARRARLDAQAGAPYGTDSAVFTGTPGRLADLLQEWQQAGLSGFRLRPGVIAHDLPAITRGLVPELQRRSAFRRGYRADTLRGLLGLPRPANRYATGPAA
ncbi:LLM class flavin-dependent oxidoreductase [Streptomyces bambusae]|uniref:LLM class flavin-dependent oxidoreductase n=1 Tax=Streptomyces bambusae TaxID=1550616 RepID=UPI001CFCE15D|nr:LLM class flavin-dependent oxidoreductase [Streptomyces bambusae]MCB5164532.1 LLM class flavin-dependent oxidoreductase [Streptomyces bambusae]